MQRRIYTWEEVPSVCCTNCGMEYILIAVFADPEGEEDTTMLTQMGCDYCPYCGKEEE